MGKSRKRGSRPFKARARVISILSILITILGGLVTLNESFRLFVFKIPELLSPPIRVFPSKLAYDGSSKNLSYVLTLENSRDKVIYDVQLRILLNDIRFDSFHLLPISGLEAEKKVFPLKTSELTLSSWASSE